MKNFTKEVILQAIQKIKENPELVKGRESFMYDLVHEEEKYPPILVLSEANKILGGNELKLVDFGNNTEKAFKILESFQFIVVKKKLTEIVEKEKDDFLKFLSHRHKNAASSKQYISGVEKAQIWFIQKGICNGSFNVWVDKDRIDYIENKLNNEFKEEWKLLNYENHHWYGSPWKAWVEFSKKGNFEEIKKEQKKEEVIFEIKRNQNENSQIRKLVDYNTKKFKIDLTKTGLVFPEALVSRLVSSLLTKPFLILTGLSGSGKTKLAQAFSKWICLNRDQYCTVPVGADWTNRDPLLGYANALSSEEYIKPDNMTLDLIIRAKNNPDEPHFLILDEMNLSHVERYFADFLSVMESKEEINLYKGNQRKSSDGSLIPPAIDLSNNLFIIGTVNIDETTYMFSPKVLDRANVIEFRVSSSEISNFLKNPQSIDLKLLDGKGAEMAKSFLEMSKNQTFANDEKDEIKETLVRFFDELKKLGAEFGYRSASEIVRLINQLGVIDSSLTINTKLDIAIMQKLLPKLHGSRRKLTPVLLKLGEFCVESGKVEKIENDIFGVEEFDCNQAFVKYPVSLEKLIRMYKGAVENGFASYAEA